MVLGYPSKLKLKLKLELGNKSLVSFFVHPLFWSSLYCKNYKLFLLQKLQIISLFQKLQKPLYYEITETSQLRKLQKSPNLAPSRKTKTRYFDQGILGLFLISYSQGYVEGNVRYMIRLLINPFKNGGRVTLSLTFVNIYHSQTA